MLSGADGFVRPRAHRGFAALPIVV